MASMFTPEAIAELEAKLRAAKDQAESNAKLADSRQASAQKASNDANTELDVARNDATAAETEVTNSETAKKQAADQLAAAKLKNDAAQKARDEAKAKVSDAETKAAAEINTAKAKAKDDLDRAKAEAQAAKKDEGDKQSALNDVLDEIKDFLKNPLHVLTDGLKQKRDQAQDAYNRAHDAAVNAASALTDKQTYLDWRDKTFSEAEKLGDDYLAMVEKFGTVAEKAMIPLRKAWRDAQRELENAGKAISDAGQAVVNAEKRLEHSKEARQVKKEAEHAKETVATEAKHAVEQAKTEVKNAAAAVKEAIDSLTNQEVVLYDITNTLSCSVNVHTGGFFANLDLNFAGLEWDSETSRAMLQGNLVMPEIDPLRLAAASNGSNWTITSNYDEIRDKFLRDPNARTYFASSRFVKWAGAQTAARAVGNAVLGNSRQVLEEAKQQIMLEYDQIYSWFTLQDIDAIDDACADALLSVLEEREPSFPTLEAKPSSVRFQYQVSVIGASFLPKPILDRVAQIYQTFVTQVQNKAPDDHFAFY